MSQASHFEKDIPEKRAIPFAAIMKNSEEIWNATGIDGAPLIGYGRSVVIEDSRGVAMDQMAVVGYIKPDRILREVNGSQLSDLFVVNESGELLVSKDIASLKEIKNLSSHALVKAAFESKTKTSVINASIDGEQVLGAYSKSHGGKLVVIAQAREGKAFAAVTELVERSLIFSLIVITVAFLAAVLLSRSLTKPLATLVERMSQVSAGDLTSQIPIETKDETALLAHGFNEMIVDLRESRDQLQEINRDLDQKVKDRTGQLEEQNRAVQEAQEALLRTTRLASAGEIAGRAAHEVLNPLTSLVTRVGVMERKIKQDVSPQIEVLKDIKEAWHKEYAEGGFEKLVKSWNGSSNLHEGKSLWQEDLGNIDSVVSALKKQIENLMHDHQFILREGGRISKIINGMRKLSVIRSEKQNYSAHALLSESAKIMADLFEQKNCEIVFAFKADFDLVNVDKDEFIQATTNMMRNSLHAIILVKRPKNEKSRLVFTTSQLEKNLCIDIEDNGVGIALENQPRLFDSQFSTKSLDEGTGLGLGISRRFIRSYGGDIEFVSSEAHVKTIFRLSLPLKLDSKEDVAA